VVFEDVYDLAARIDDPALDVTADSVLVLRDSGPKGAPGMPEWGQLPIPAKLLKAGVSDMVRISDARMSGTSFGTVVLHVVPESAARGPLAIVLGSEADGLGAAWSGPAMRAVRLPMLGIADSLNVSAAAAILLYEARRQRSPA